MRPPRGVVPPLCCIQQLSDGALLRCDNTALGVSDCLCSTQEQSHTSFVEDANKSLLPMYLRSTCATHDCPSCHCSKAQVSERSPLTHFSDAVIVFLAISRIRANYVRPRSKVRCEKNTTTSTLRRVPGRALGGVFLIWEGGIC